MKIINWLANQIIFLSLEWAGFVYYYFFDEFIRCGEIIHFF